MDSTRPEMPSHLCSQYILSSPPSQGSNTTGRTASTIAALITPMASTPLPCIKTLRQAKKWGSSAQTV
ncbi:hypothetical protein D3C72_2495570 [compost metagenome]